MADEVKFSLEGDRIDADALIEALSDFLRLLKALDKAIAKKQTVRWRIGTLQHSSPAMVGLIGTPRKQNQINNAPMVAAALKNGITSLSGRRRPTHFTDEALEISKDLADIEGTKGVRRVRVLVDDSDFTMGPPISDYVNELIGPSTESLGTVEGRLELIGARKGALYCSIQERSTGKAIRFEVPRDRKSEVLNLFDSNVVAEGTVYRDSSGQARKIEITAIRPSGLDALPTSIFGIDPDFTEGEESAKWLKKRW